ncbi:hotdog fold thioesterase [Methanosarcinaceae archaeon]|nr:hotdog fold thioesterase [Methanosarcinaceae archaeon]MBQ3621019.1 hotdog fold thioesterase [Methanosarcinaceae archaeon]
MYVPGKTEFIEGNSEIFTLSCCPSADDLNVNGTVHGGFIFFLCDEAIGRYVTASGKTGAAADADIHYYRPGKAGEKMTVSVTERKTGRRLGIYLTEVRNENGVLLADAMFTIAFAPEENRPGKDHS